MTDPLPAPAALPARVPTWIKVALALSVALNLAIAGLALGAFLQDGPGRGGLPRDLGFGPFSAALTDTDRQALRAALRERFPDLRVERAAARDEFGGLVQALRAQPFDTAALSAALARIEARLTGRIGLGRQLIEQHLLAMSDVDRAAFAARLETDLRRAAGN